MAFDNLVLLSFIIIIRALRIHPGGINRVIKLVIDELLDFHKAQHNHLSIALIPLKKTINRGMTQISWHSTKSGSGRVGAELRECELQNGYPPFLRIYLIKAAFHPCVNVYIDTPINRSE